MTQPIAGIGVAALFTIVASTAGAQTVFNAELSPLNTNVTGSEARGTATLTMSGDTLTVRIEAMGTAPNIMHLQHFHGFTEGAGKSGCPGGDADANGDGLIDLIETEAVAGVTMVPFHGDPTSLEIVADSYPTADNTGAYLYEETVSLSALNAAFESRFPGQQMDLDRRVIFLHGVPAETNLPDTVQSLGEVPAQVTIPIACGELSADAQ
jgi:hypothetical protein